jgi:YHS domain-containing protein
MSAERQQRKLSGRTFFAQIGFALLVLTTVSPVPAGHAATTERIVADPIRGLALSGFDPVSYFTDGKPLMGRGDLEMSFAGVTWRFRNEGNRAAFAANPEVYLPVFGGHDPVAVTRGVATPGHPQIWLITGERLYLFYNAEARTSFAAAPETVAGQAEEKWPDVLMTISP